MGFASGLEVNIAPGRSENGSRKKLRSYSASHLEFGEFQYGLKNTMAVCS